MKLRTCLKSSGKLSLKIEQEPLRKDSNKDRAAVKLQSASEMAIHGHPLRWISNPKEHLIWTRERCENNYYRKYK
jgi:hypothetical protein